MKRQSVPSPSKGVSAWPTGSRRDKANSPARGELRCSVKSQIRMFFQMRKPPVSQRLSLLTP
ncbi:hypothetical protein LCGC14_1258430 [marine sediment metagenome]|uniref:Uncharacterized protein n=1 Tax=marine sediment metagenome TaxID=412755 RepID=A0A0F9LMR6_9ZZZZ